MRFCLPVVILFLIASLSSLNAQNTPDFIPEGTTYLWPTNASNYFSATFAETRSAHFHAAADIGTWAREGYDVYATRDGILYRVTISPYGYGTVIYLKHDDGSYSLYAHMQEVNDEIRAIADSVRFNNNYVYTFDEVLEHKNIRYRQGDFLGRTGSTGIGPPHLHFELRTPTNKPFNPKLVGVDIPDSVPPVFSAIAVEPLSADALVNGSKNIFTRNSPGGRHPNFGTIRVSGDVGLAVNVSDRADSGRNVYAVYELKLEINDELYFHSRVDSFSYETTRQMLIDRVYPLLVAGRGGYQRMYIADGNQLYFYKDTGRSGVVSLPSGTHNFRITAKDFAGNTTFAYGRLQVEEPRLLKQPKQFNNRWADSKVKQFQGQNHEITSLFHWDSAWIAPRNTGVQSLAIQPIGSPLPVDYYINLRPNEGIILPDADVFRFVVNETEHAYVHRIHPGKYSTINLPDSGVEVTFRPMSVFDTTHVVINRELLPNRDRIYVTPGLQPLQRDYTIKVLLPVWLRGVDGVGLYAFNERRNRYDYQTGVVRGDTLIVNTRHTGMFELRVDNAPPLVSRPAIWQRRADGRWFASVRAVDLQTGLDFDNAEFYVNGERGLPAYVPDNNQLRFDLPGWTPRRGANQIEVVVPDRAGNVASHSFTVNR